MTKRLQFWQLYFAVILAAGVLVGTGLVQEWGRWYSANPAYRRQTEALLKGSLALEADPRGLVWDMVWANGGVQQVWGLGAPCWRLPFEFLARIFRQPAFPDRLTFGVAIALLAYAVSRVFLTRPACNDSYQWFCDLRRYPEEVAALFVLLLFPPFLTICRFRF